MKSGRNKPKILLFSGRCGIMYTKAKSRAEASAHCGVALAIASETLRMLRHHQRKRQYRKTRGKRIMKRSKILLFVCLFLLTGCGRLNDMNEIATTPAPVVVGQGQTAPGERPESGREDETEPELQIGEIVIDYEPERKPVKVKGIYISAYVAGTPSMVDTLLEEIDKTEINTLVIDLKDDFGRVSCEVDSPLIQELGSVRVHIQDMEGLMNKLRERDIYAIARIPAFRDAWLGTVRPEWCVQYADGSVFTDKDGNSWVNPYREEAWDYLVEIGIQAKKLGFQEVQFDYVRFCTESSMEDVVFREEDTRGRSRTDVICEFMEYAYRKLREQGLFVSADVFGAIINSDVNANAVGQIYGELAKHVDYISPMIYPSHYGDGYYGIDYPDMHPYETITAALQASRKEIYFARDGQEHIAIVRPWLQDFTASWLMHYIPYGADQVREQIQATYDAGYDEWLLWDASCRYDWDGLLSPEEAKAEADWIAQSRAALPESTFVADTVGEAPTETAQPSAGAQYTGLEAGPPVPTGSAGPTVGAYMGED